MIRVTQHMPEEPIGLFGGGMAPIYPEISKFPCGESKVSVPAFADPEDHVEIEFSYNGDEELIQLLLLVDALERSGYKKRNMLLRIGYMPYGRQDRVCNPGEPHSLKVICQMINSMGVGRIIVEDPHSDVIEALLDNVEVMTISDILACSDHFCEYILDEVDVFVSPDAGAYKKVSKVASRFPRGGLVRADKIRDTQTGAISDIEVYAQDLEGLTVLIVDDICDGGGTFIGLANKLKEKGAANILLYTTHGMYTKGVDVLLKNGVDKVICKNYHGPSSEQHKVVILD